MIARIVREYRFWLISVLLGWCLDLTPAERECAELIQCWAWAAGALGRIK
jgi:hypothetical protein